MGAKQQWEAALKTCDTLGDLAVDQRTSALVRQAQTLLRREPLFKKAARAYELASLARDALTHGDKQDAQAQLQRLTELLGEAPQQQDAPARTAQDTAGPVLAGQAAENPMAPRKSVIRRTSMAIFNKLRSALGGERGKQAAQNAMLSDKREAIDRQIAAWEQQMAALQKERDQLQASLSEKVEKARALDKADPAYIRLRHEAMVIKPQIDTLGAQLTRLMGNIEKYAKVSAVYRSGQLNAMTQLNERDLTEASVLVEQINEQIDVAADLDKELDAVLKKSDRVQQRILDQASEQADTFFEGLVSGEDTQTAAAAEDDPFAQMVADADARAQRDKPAEDPLEI